LILQRRAPNAPFVPRQAWVSVDAIIGVPADHPTAVVRAIPNLLTVLRLVIALGFPMIPVSWRLAAIVVGGLSDGIDGFIARRYHADTRVGAVLDAIADKVFTLSVLATLTMDGPIRAWQVPLLLARDIMVALLAAMVVVTRGWSSWKHVRPRLGGKLATAAVIGVMLVAVAAPAWTGWAVAPAAVLSVLAGLDYGRAEFHRPTSA
jgi:cardiolipin synthase (CMP-forming)